MKTEMEIWFGGSFDPVHNGHLITARFAAEAIGAEKVVLVPAMCSPLKHGTAASAEDRLSMLESAVKGDDLFAVSDIELQRTGPSYTIDTIEQAAGERKGRGATALLIGADVLEELPSWHRVDDLLGLVRIIVACRPPMSPDCIRQRVLPAITGRLGKEATEQLKNGLISSPLIDISSTDIRRRIKEGASVRYLVPEPVETYIRKKHLYIS